MIFYKKQALQRDKYKETDIMLNNRAHVKPLFQGLYANVFYMMTDSTSSHIEHGDEQICL